MTSAMTTDTSVSSVSSSPSASASAAFNPKKSTKYIVATYSFIAAIAVLMLGAISNDGVLMLPVVLVSIMAIACIGQVILDLKRHPQHRFSKF